MNPSRRSGQAEGAGADGTLRRSAGALEAANFAESAQPAQREGIGAVERNDAAQRLRSPQGRLWAAHDLDPRQDVIREQLEPPLIACGGIVEADSIDEQQCVVGLRAADADLRLRAPR